MDILKIKGYATPEEYPDRNDAVKLQKALNAAEEADVRKVVLCGKYEIGETVFIPSLTHLVLEKDAEVRFTSPDACFTNRVSAESEKHSWSFEDSRIYIEGSPNAKIAGDLKFYHARYVIFDGVTVEGQVRFEFCRDVRMENTGIEAPDTPLIIARGCNNFILERLALKGSETALALSADLAFGDYVIGKDADVHEIILKDSVLNAAAAIRIGGNDTNGVFNVQIDHIKTEGNGLVLGEAGKSLPKERFFNITATDFETEKTAVICHNETIHCYFGE